MQQKLFDIKPIRIERPNVYNIHNFNEVYSNIALVLIEWNSYDFPKDQLEEIVSQLKEIITPIEIFNSDAYILTKKLECFIGQEADMNLCKKLIFIRSFFNSFIEKEIKKWVVDCQITPKFSKEDIVKVKIKNHEYFGEITSIESNARYCIYVEELERSFFVDFEYIEHDFFSNKHWK